MESLDALGAITRFLASIGLVAQSRRLDAPTLLPGVTVEAGTLVYDPSRLAWPGDLLHEAGHIAVTPPALRSRLSGNIAPELMAPHAGEPEATAWAYAAIKAIGLPASVLFHPEGYHGKSAGLILTFESGCYPGAAGLIAAGMARSLPEAQATGASPYPAMIHWLRHA
ncbi:MAG: hypothetical protein AB7P08_09755 [Burkholderiales bacterium]